jgi:hypothetical protein
MTFTFFFALAQDSRFFGRKEFKEFENVGKASEHCKAVPNRSSNGAYPNVLEPVTCTPWYSPAFVLACSGDLVVKRCHREHVFSVEDLRVLRRSAAGLTSLVPATTAQKLTH